MTTEYEAITESEWKDLATTETTHLTDEEKDYLPRAWDEWIARVRRDAKAEAWDEAYRRGVDALAAAEHRATRAEAQSALRGRAVVMYRERAREAEAEVKRLSWKCGHLADKYDTDTEELRQEVDRAEERIKAVLAVLGLEVGDA